MVKKVMYLETIEQVRALMEPTRLRIVQELSAGATTSKQVAQAMGQSVPKILYHLKELEEQGLIRTVKQTRTRNLLESHYAPVARSFRTHTDLEEAVQNDGATQKELLSRALLVASNAVEEAAVRFVNLVEEVDAATYDTAIRPQILENGVNLDHASLQVTQQEYDSFLEEYRALLQRYRRLRKSRKRKAVDLYWLSLPGVEAFSVENG